MSDEIESLRAQNDDLRKTADHWTGRLRETEGKLTEAQGENERLCAENAQLRADAEQMARAWSVVDWIDSPDNGVVRTVMLVHGLLEPYSPIRRCGDDCACAGWGVSGDGTFPRGKIVECYRRAPVLLRYAESEVKG